MGSWRGSQWTGGRLEIEALILEGWKKEKKEMEKEMEKEKEKEKENKRQKIEKTNNITELEARVTLLPSLLPVAFGLWPP